MINITIYEEDGGLMGFECEGHADAGEQGYDIVCSAVSALSINTLNAIESLTGVSFSEDHDEEGGYLRMMLETGKDPGSQLLMQALKLGLEQMASSYPENVSLNEAFLSSEDDSAESDGNI